MLFFDGNGPVDWINYEYDSDLGTLSFEPYADLWDSLVIKPVMFYV